MSQLKFKLAEESVDHSLVSHRNCFLGCHEQSSSVFELLVVGVGLNVLVDRYEPLVLVLR